MPCFAFGRRKPAAGEPIIIHHSPLTIKVPNAQVSNAKANSAQALPAMPQLL